MDKRQVFQIRTSILTFLKWLIFSAVIGVVVGVAGALFHHAIEWGTATRAAHGWLLFLLPVAGLAIVASYHITGMADDRGTEFVLASVRDNKPLRIRTAPLIFLGTVLTHLTGGSAGREGAALQLGGTISSTLGRLVRLDEKDERVITMCGMAAGFAALFGTPLAAAVFAMEVVSVGVMYYAAAVPCVLAALVAQMIAAAMGVQPTTLSLETVPELTWVLLLQILALGAGCACVAVLFCWVMHKTPGIYAKLTPNPYVRAAVGGGLVVLVSLVLGGDYNGAGMDVIRRAVAGEAKPWAFAVKILLTAVTLGAGFKGGEIVPAFFAGATFGCVLGSLLGLPAGFGVAVGMTAVFCGVTNCPMTSILISYELFGGAGLPLFALGCVTAYILSGYSSVYLAQKIVYAKLRAEYVDHETH